MKIYIFFKRLNYLKLLKRIQLITAYAPLILVPFIFSPLSVDPFYLEKIFVILVFSSISLISWAIRLNLLKRFSKNETLKNLNRRDRKEIEKEEDNKFYSTNLTKYAIIFCAYVFLSQMFSVNFNQSFWGAGSALYLSILIWLIAIYQVFDKEKIKAFFVLGVTIVSALNIFFLITRISGSGAWEIIKPGLSVNGNILSLLFILYLSIYLTFKSSFTSRYKYIYISSLFLNIACFIIFAYLGYIYIFAYISLFFLLGLYFFPFIKSLIKKQNKEINDYNLKGVVTIASLLIGVFELIFQKSLLTLDRFELPLNFSWSIVIRTLTDSIKNFLIGVGPNNFLYTFVHYKPTEINNTPYWNLDYVSSLYGGFEILTGLGLFIFVLFIYFYIKKHNWRKFNIKEYLIYQIKNNLFNFISIILAVFLFFFTPLNLTNIWGAAIVFLFIFKEPVGYYLNFNINNDRNILQKFILTIVLVTAIPLLYISISFYNSSLTVMRGFYKNDLNRIVEGVSIFPYNLKIFGKALEGYSKNINNANTATYSDVFLDYARRSVILNPSDPSSNIVYVNYLNTSKDTLAYNEIVSTYGYLLKLAPNHMPYLLSLADSQLQYGNYDYAMNAVDTILALNPNLDIALLKKANIYFLQNKYDDAIKYCNMAISNTKNDDIKNGAQNILDKIHEVKGDK